MVNQKNRQLRFALIGVGNIAPHHALAIKATPGAELVATATRNAERGSAFVNEQGGTLYADYHDMLAREDVDVVAICTPHDLHAPMTIDAARAGKHVLCEKPMARNLAECGAMIVACKQARVTLGILFQMRFDPLALKLKKIIDDEKLGRLIWTNTHFPWYRTDEYYQSGAWRGTWEHEGGGVLINQAIHVIDLMLWLTGMPTRVTAQMRTLNHSVEVEDAAVALLEYGSNRLGSLQATVAAYPGYPERLEIAGTRGSAVYQRGEARLEWHIAEPREDGEERAEASRGAGAPMNINAAGHIAAYQDFAAALREGRAPRVDGHEGRKSIELVEAIYRSAQRRAAVDLGE